MINAVVSGEKTLLIIEATIFYINLLFKGRTAVTKQIAFLSIDSFLHNLAKKQTGLNKWG